MNKLFLISLILVLIVVTTITKNSTKQIENKIFSTKENISALQDEIEKLKRENADLKSTISDAGIAV